jgi:hypothetical protein
MPVNPFSVPNSTEDSTPTLASLYPSSAITQSSNYLSATVTSSAYSFADTPQIQYQSNEKSRSRRATLTHIFNDVGTPSEDNPSLSSVTNIRDSRRRSFQFTTESFSIPSNNLASFPVQQSNSSIRIPRSRRTSFQSTIQQQLPELQLNIQTDNEESKRTMYSNLQSPSIVSSLSIPSTILIEGGALSSMSIATSRLSIDVNEREPKLTLNDFKMLGLIGSGSFAKVHLTKLVISKMSLNLKTKYAMKSIPKSKIKHKSEALRILHEKFCWENLTGEPGIIQLFTTFQDSTYLHFLIEAAVCDLHSIISKLKFVPENIAIFFAASLVSSISFIHSKTIIYRDMKPEVS